MSNDSSSTIVVELRRWIEAAGPGARLPSTRELVREHAVSPLTVQKALRVLSTEGLIESRPGVGTFVRRARAVRSADHGWQTAALGTPDRRLPGRPSALRVVSPDTIPLHSGYPDRDLLPEKLVRAAFTRAARSDHAIVRSPGSGLPELRAFFAAELAAAAPSGVTPPTAGDVLVVPGSQSGLNSIFRTLVPPRGALLVESPTYWGALAAAAQAGVQVVPVPSGPQGPDPAAVDRAFRESGARVFYAQPTFANPTGARWSAETGREILDLVRRHGAFLVEDDWAHDFAFDGDARPLAAQDDAGHVVYLRSLSKSVSPAMRVAAVVARGPAGRRLAADQDAETMYVSGVLQLAALEVVTHPGWRTHLRGMQRELRARRDLLVAELRARAPQAEIAHLPSGGLNLWIQLPPETDVGRLVPDCERAGLAVADGTEWFPAEPPAPYVRISFSAADPSGFADAARILGAQLPG